MAKVDVKAYLNHPYVLARRKDGLVIFNYDHACTYDKAWDDITLSARGLIVEEDTGKVVARPFKKFFNLGEVPETQYTSLPDLPFTATEKMDGYLGIHFKWRGEDFISTRGSFDSEMAVWGTDWFRKNVNSSVMDPEWTYLFEIVYSRKIVISYDFEGLVLLAAINKETGEELPYDRLVHEAELMGVRVTPLMPDFKNLEELAKYVKGLPSNREGCVVTFSNGLKVKIKGDEYCRIHKLVCHMTPLAFWEAYDVSTGQIPKEYLSGIPEEFRETSDALKEAVEGKINEAAAAVERACREIEASLPPGVDDKTFVMRTRETYPDMFDWIMFFHKGKIQRMRDAIHRKTRPTGNVLPDGIPGMDRIRRVLDEG